MDRKINLEDEQARTGGGGEKISCHVREGGVGAALIQTIATGLKDKGIVAQGV